MKMIKEERLIRREINSLIEYAFKTTPVIAATRKGQLGQKIYELVEAVREDAARVAEGHKDKYSSNEPFVMGILISLADDIAAAIRGRGKK